MTQKEQQIKIANNMELILDSVKKGLISNMENIDILKVVEFDFENNVLKMKLPAVEKNISFEDILKILK